MKRYGWHPFWNGDMSYSLAMLFYSLITVIAIFAIVVHSRYRAKRKSKYLTEFKEVSLEIKKIEKRKYFKSTLVLLKDKEDSIYSYLNNSTSTLDLKPGVIQATINLDTKVIIEIIKN